MALDENQAMKPIIEVQGLKIRYHHRNSHVDAVRDVSFVVQRGEFVGICGLNGSGKTSLLSALNGLIPHFYKASMRGRVMVDGCDTQDHTVAELSRKIGFVFDNPFNQLSYTTETVRHEIAFGLCNQNVACQEMEARVLEAAELVGVSHLLDCSPLALSGGQLQRIAIASVMVMKPDVLMLDECTSQLDPLGAKTVFEVVGKLHSDGMTIVCVDHDIERLTSFADRIMVLSGGKIKAFDSPAAILQNEQITHFGFQPHVSYRIARFLSDQGVKGAKECLTYNQLRTMIKGQHNDDPRG